MYRTRVSDPRRVRQKHSRVTRNHHSDGPLLFAFTAADNKWQQRMCQGLCTEAGWLGKEVDTAAESLIWKRIDVT
jgi:hypothetical protein